MKCSWCLENKAVFHKHHFPIDRKNGGKGIVEICSDCHAKIHGRIMRGFGFHTRTPQKSLRYYWEKTYQQWLNNMPGLPYWLWMFKQKSITVSPIWMMERKNATDPESYPSAKRFYGFIYEHIERRVSENLPCYVQENDWLAEALRQNQLLTTD